MSEFTEVSGYNVNVQKLVYFYILATNNYTFKLNKRYQLYSIKNMKYLRINLIKDV